MTNQMDHKLPLLDTQTLQVLHTLLVERSVTKTAVRLDQSQPAISIVLKRLRTLFGDELLVRTGNRMVPTARGEALQPILRDALDSLSRIFATKEVFDPATSRASWHIGCPDYLATVYLAEVVGSKPLPRTEVVKKLWAYIKKKGLQDKKNKRMINADDTLKAVFAGKKQVSMFEMTKLVSKHLK